MSPEAFDWASPPHVPWISKLFRSTLKNVTLTLKAVSRLQFSSFHVVSVTFLHLQTLPMPRGSNCTGKNLSARLESVNSCWYRTLASSATASTLRMLFLLRVKKFESCLVFTNNIFPKRRTRDSELSLNFNGWGATTCARSSFRWWCWWSSLGSRSSSSSAHTTHVSPSCHSRCFRWSFCATSSKPPKLPTLKRSIFTREFPWLLLSLPSTVSSVNKSIRNWFKIYPFSIFVRQQQLGWRRQRLNYQSWQILSIGVSCLVCYLQRHLLDNLLN